MNNQTSDQSDTINGTEKKSVESACCGIYGLQNKLKPDKWYIGLSKDIYDRWNTAYKKLKCKNQKKIYHALLKYGYDGFRKVVLEECSNDKISEREIYWVKFYNSVDNGYNLSKGGQVCTEKQLKKLSHYNSFPEHMKKYNLDWKDGTRIFTKEWKEKISLAKKGVPTKKHTEETKRKMSIIAIEREKKKRGLGLVTNQTF